ncbi:XylR N-terminal domain-containing protein [Salibacterium aidingense]|uniref:XylR N-terminal domain-containing protein n=1 Tax=Salibacterium aidingense TaxID=384933 RepID=UPI0004223E48|nr:XylR N-terminal domain-containing protein [Salibacterium aidingense]
MNIKASDFTLNHLINVSERTGENWKDLELIMTSAEAWGMLRKDLITALGVERAKRFLLRYGYKCGEHEARMLNEKINWKSEIDWLTAGSKLHHLTGRVFSYPEHFDVDMQKGKFNVSGYWIDSYEAKQHLHYFSTHNEAVCYYLVGYASGYTSACMGKSIFFKEIKCKGKGDDYCSYVGKTLEEWGEEIQEELFYFEDDDMSGELDKMYQKLEQQKERLEIGYSLSSKLNQALLEEKGLPAFAEILGESIQSQVLIEDKHFKEIAFYRKTPGIKKVMTAQNTWSGYENSTVNNDIVETDIPNHTIKLVTTPICVRQQTKGYLTIALNQKSDSFYQDLLKRTATVASLQIQNERIALETEQRLKGELLEKLLHSKDTNVQEIYNQFSYLGYDLTKEHYVLHIEIDDTNEREDVPVDNEQLLNIRNQLNNFYQGQNEYGPNMLILTKWNKIQAVITKEFIENRNTTIKMFGEKILKKINGKESQVYIGISTETKKFTDFHNRAKEAKQAAELAKKKSSFSQVILANELGHLSLFLYAREPEELEQFAEDKLHAVLSYDEMKSSELLKTLFYYSQHEFNLHKTAREMSISISGMRYRVQKVEELLNLDLSNSNDRFEIQLSLQILLMLGKL